eukprot:CAMPEP_0171072500 /NCGR_PEP_ID=MMETSP0766_2-20121228/10899_1 /TAXON_ID=439317 /ORGANISM="Gambierdiscus australes, Strain CAWD 149" /LENGTH=374 /DNA_ID=CAMNT_0011529091 /DNA_START=79 /DNA_END=1200 /DNA_ORIENTATION=+
MAATQITCQGAAARDSGSEAAAVSAEGSLVNAAPVCWDVTQGCAEGDSMEEQTELALIQSTLLQTQMRLEIFPDVREPQPETREEPLQLQEIQLSSHSLLQQGLELVPNVVQSKAVLADGTVSTIVPATPARPLRPALTSEASTGVAKMPAGIQPLAAPPQGSFSPDAVARFATATAAPMYWQQEERGLLAFLRSLPSSSAMLQRVRAILATAFPPEGEQRLAEVVGQRPDALGAAVWVDSMTYSFCVFPMIMVVIAIVLALFVHRGREEERQVDLKGSLVQLPVTLQQLTAASAVDCHQGRATTTWLRLELSTGTVVLPFSAQWPRQPTIRNLAFYGGGELRPAGLLLLNVCTAEQASFPVVCLNSLRGCCLF